MSDTAARLEINMDISDENNHSIITDDICCIPGKAVHSTHLDI